MSVSRGQVITKSGVEDAIGAAIKLLVGPWALCDGARQERGIELQSRLLKSKSRQNG